MILDHILKKAEKKQKDLDYICKNTVDVFFSEEERYLNYIIKRQRKE